MQKVKMVSTIHINHVDEVAEDNEALIDLQKNKKKFTEETMEDLKDEIASILSIPKESVNVKLRYTLVKDDK